MRSTIICGIDDSTHGVAAARLTGALADRLALRAVFVHAVSDAPVMASIPASPVAAHGAAERMLAEVASETATAEVELRVAAGRATECIVATAEAEDAAFVVVGTHGYGAGRTTLLGSVALETVRTAPCPVIVVPPGAAQRALPLAGGRIVCGVSGNGDRAAVAAAARLARRLDLTLTLAHVLPHAVDGDGEESPYARPLLAWAKAMGQDLLRDMAAAEPGWHELRLCAGEPAQQLAALATQERAAMIAVGTRGLGPLRSGLLGSVSRWLACHGTLPLLVCRTPDDPG